VRDKIALPITMRPNVSRYLMILPGMLIISAIGVVLLYVGLTEGKLAALPFGGLFCLLAAFLVLNLRSGLTLTEEGFVFRQAFRELRVRWEDVEDFVPFSRLAVGWNYRANHKPMTIWRKLNRGGGMEASVPGMFGGKSAVELARLMNRLRLASLPAPTLTGEQRFALATGAPLAEMNGHRHDLLQGDTPGQLLQMSARTVLKDDWDVGGPKPLEETLGSLSEKGHRSEYDQIRAALEAAAPGTAPLDLLEKESAKRLSSKERKEFERAVAFVDAHRGEHPSILAWDLCRLVAVARFGAAAGYLSEEAAWKWILDAAGQLRSAFTSWRALGENYAIGRGFWGSSDGAELYQRAMEVLLDPANATSPWNQVPWPGGR
jgi:hypothetical protein